MRPFQKTRESVVDAVTSVDMGARDFGATMRTAASTLGLVGAVAVIALGLALTALLLITGMSSAC
jgi:hypothetical protein